MKNRRRSVEIKPTPRTDLIDSGSLERLPSREHQLSEGDEPLLLERAVKQLYPELSWNQARSLIQQGKVALNGERTLEAQRLVSSGARVEVTPNRSGTKGRREAAPLLLHVDSQIVIVNKPSGIATVPFENSERNSLDKLVAKELGRGGRPARLHVVHRLDKETSGVLVFARTDAALKHLKNQFRFHTSSRRYVALVHGSAHHATYRSHLVTDRGDGLRGSTNNPELGREAITHVRLLERLQGASLVECRLETGRTHQIRIHLSEAGTPLLGERVYIRHFAGPILQAARVMLHAEELAIDHPTQNERMTFQSKPPNDFSALLEQLRSKG